MSLRGVKQLRELVVRYSDIDGSSRGIREWIKKDLTGLAAANPETIFRTGMSLLLPLKRLLS